MKNKASEHRLHQFIVFAGFFIIVSISLSWDLSRAFYVILALVGIWQLIRNFPRLDRDQILFCAPIVILYCLALLSYLVNDSPKRGPQILIETFLLLLFALPVLHLYMRHPPRLKIVWGFFLLGALAMGLSAIATTLFGFQARAGGSTGQAVLFSTIALGTTGIVAFSYHYLRNYSARGRILFFAAVISGIAAIFLSGSRTAWIGIPFVLIFMFLYYFGDVSRSKKLTAMLIFFVALPAASYQLPLVQKRIDRGIDQLTRLLAEDASLADRDTGVGIRVELWRAGLEIFSDNPLLGVGPGSFRMAMKKYVANNETVERLPDMKHTHNQYINTLMTKGILGAIALLLMLALHTYIFVRHIKSGSAEIKPLAIAACMVIGTYVLLGLTSAPLERKITLVFYAFSLSVLLGKIISLKQSEANQNPLAENI